MTLSCRDETVNTALVQAIRAQSLERVVLALDAGADPNNYDEHNCCLVIAVTSRFLPVRCNVFFVDLHFLIIRRVHRVCEHYFTMVLIRTWLHHLCGKRSRCSLLRRGTSKYESKIMWVCLTLTDIFPRSHESC